MSERLTLAQRAALSGKTEEQRAVIEEESSLWMVQCRNCGFEASVWDRGGVRTGARGAKTQRLRCPDCGKRGAHDVYWAGREEPAGSPLREAGRVDRNPPPVTPPPSPVAAPRERLPFWLAVLLLMAVAFLSREVFGVDVPVVLLVIIGVALFGARREAATPEANRVTTTMGGLGCLLMLGLVLFGWILSRTIFLAQQG